MPKHKILVLEDNSETQQLLRYILVPHYEAVFVADDEQALEAASCEAFDAFLLDINIGRDLTGEDVMRALRRDPRHVSVPMIAVTAYAMPGDREHFLRAGFDAYIGKPFKRAQLFEVLDEVFAGERE